MSENRQSGQFARVMKFGTARCRQLLNLVGSPDDKLKIIHIAGTNGKGSICEYFTQILVEMGLKTGTFCSPMVYSYYDQFRIDGVPVEEKKFDECLEKLTKLAQPLGATPFEIETAAAIYFFAEANCEWAVIECGLGGRDDSTNAVNKKELAVISSISLEHTEFLGGTIEEICRHKSGIIKGKCVVNALQSEQGLEYFKAKGATICSVPRRMGDCEFEYDGQIFEINSCGEEQFFNAATAVEGAKMLGFPLESIKKGLKKARLFGRQEVIERDKLFILDGGHNPKSLFYLSEILKKYPKIDLIFSCLSDKDVVQNVKNLSGVTDRIILVPAPSPRAMDLEKISKAAERFFEQVVVAENVLDGMEQASREVVVVCGTFTILKEARQWIEKRQ